MGKSTTASLLRERGVPLVDTDDLARDLVRPGQPALEQIVEYFGPAILDEHGELRRAELAAKVFADSGERAKLESILHPLIRAAWERQVKRWESEGQTRAAVIIPLLFETNAQTLFTWTVCVACSESAQKERLRGRGWSDEEIQQRVQAQLPISRKMELADFVIWTEGPIDIHRAQLARVVR